MTTAAAVSTPTSVIKEKRNVGMGIFFLVIALAIIGLFAFNTTSDMTTTFGLNPGAKTNAPSLEPWVLPTQNALYFLAIIIAFIGGVQLAKGIKRVYLALFVVCIIFVFAFLMVLLISLYWGLTTRAVSEIS